MIEFYAGMFAGVLMFAAVWLAASDIFQSDDWEDWN